MWNVIKWNWGEILFTLGKWTAIGIVGFIVVGLILALLLGFIAAFIAGGGFGVYLSYNAIAESQGWGEIDYVESTTIFFLVFLALQILRK